MERRDWAVVLLKEVRRLAQAVTRAEAVGEGRQDCWEPRCSRVRVGWSDSASGWEWGRAEVVERRRGASRRRERERCIVPEMDLACLSSVFTAPRLVGCFEQLLIRWAVREREKRRPQLSSRKMVGE